MKISLRTLLLIVTSLCVYIGAYFRLASPIEIAEESHVGMVSKGHREPGYRIQNQFISKVFLPAYCIDYALRKDFWDDCHDDFDARSRVTWESMARRREKSER